MATPSEPHQPYTMQIPFRELGGWPATVGNRRMAMAFNHLKAKDPNHDFSDVRRNVLTEVPHNIPRDSQLAEDIYMLQQAVIANHYPATLNDYFKNLPENPFEQLEAIFDLAQAMESPATFGGLVVSNSGPPHYYINPPHIMLLLRHPEWMGASTYLPSFKDQHIRAIESNTFPGKPGMFLALPVNRFPNPLPESPFPEGEPALFKTVAMWHQAASCHWIPRDGGQNDDKTGPRHPLLSELFT